MTSMQISTGLFLLLTVYCLYRLVIGSAVRLYSRQLTSGYVFTYTLLSALFMFLGFAATVWDVQGQSWSGIADQ